MAKYGFLQPLVVADLVSSDIGYFMADVDADRSVIWLPAAQVPDRVFVTMAWDFCLAPMPLHLAREFRLPRWLRRDLRRFWDQMGARVLADLRPFTDDWLSEAA